jgi:hypothetical protein
VRDAAPPPADYSGGDAEEAAVALRAWKTSTIRDTIPGITLGMISVTTLCIILDTISCIISGIILVFISGIIPGTIWEMIGMPIADSVWVIIDGTTLVNIAAHFLEDHSGRPFGYHSGYPLGNHLGNHSEGYLVIVWGIIWVMRGQ